MQLLLKAEFAKHRDFIRVTAEKGGYILSGDRNLLSDMTVPQAKFFVDIAA